MDSYIKMKSASLDFPIYEGLDLSFRNKLTKFGKLGTTKIRNSIERKIVRGLDNIDLDIKKGDKVAIIGPNGSGKTTLLKLLAGIYTPTSGEIQIHGKISSMIDLGFGFVDDATGYENIILSRVISGETIKDKNSIM